MIETKTWLTYPFVLAERLALEARKCTVGEALRVHALARGFEARKRDNEA